MRPLFLVFAVAVFFPHMEILAQDEKKPDEAAFARVEAGMSKLRAGENKPTEEDLRARRAAGVEVASGAEQFLKDFPESKKAEDAQGLINLGLHGAAVAGDTNAAAQLDRRAKLLARDPKVSESLRRHALLVNFQAQWARQRGVTSIDYSAPETRKLITDSHFAVLDEMPEKESTFKMILLQAKSGRGLDASEKLALARRVQEHPDASPTIKDEAARILSGALPFELGKPIDLQFTALDGRKVDIKSLRGKVVFVDFWATWCGPCVAALPALKATYDKYHSQGLEIIGISLDEDKPALISFIKKHGMAWPQHFDGKSWNNEISFRFGIDAVPTLWIFDKKGNLQSTKHHADEQSLAGIFLKLNSEPN